MQVASLKDYLISKKKLHLLNSLSNLTDYTDIDQVILQLDLDELEAQLSLFSSKETTPGQIQPFLNYDKAGHLKWQKEGFQKIQSGRVGCVLIAGGQGSRLEHSGPKGTYPISLVEKKSLFQLFAEKVKALSDLVHFPLKMAVMTSPLNHEATLKHFKDHDFFGLKRSQIDFFEQPMLPFLDEDQKLFLSDENKIAAGPDGNGSFFKAFSESQILSRWKAENIEAINFVLVDNPLADPFDFEMIGSLCSDHADVVVKTCMRQNAEEKVGILVSKENRLEVIEYTEIPDDFSYRAEPLANLSLFTFSMTFAEKMAQQKLPLHRVKKACARFDPALHKKVQTMAWKFESYIFDVLPLAEKVNVIDYPRAEVFSPLKDLKGPQNPKAVQQALLNKETQILKKRGIVAPLEPFELSAKDYYTISDWVQSI